MLNVPGKICCGSAALIIWTLNEGKHAMTDRDKKLIRNSTAEFLIFTGQAGEQNIEARYEDETIWLTQQLMAELFQSSKQNISHHIRSIFDEGELNPEATVKKYLTVRQEGKRQVQRELEYYNLDMIISVGYRVNSVRATQFRQWATQVLREFAIKGYVLDKKRMENGAFLGEDYFERLLEEIREIRLSERRFYQKITDIYATSVDYNRDAPTTKAFFAKVQNKLHFAIHGHTAAELILQRADSTKANMGLTTWEKAPDGKILKTDVAVAKNYLAKEELEALGRIVNAYLDLAEERALRKIPMTMEDWAKRLDAFLEFTERDILQHSGKVSADIAKAHAESEFEKYRIVQDRLFESDFDRIVKQIESAGEEKPEKE
ncbi:virulence RhuM family protein [Desulfatitalea alkaliphila]|uniref:Virulence RhuM family protein n=1 Tax=Desulfatitalea alkaliphila TaxID=2929485 RepID=A0AA41QZY9_9BACT|nr:virulence RhuM family protein [Desulfatitalea alkaliphila]MCJ8499519.1 virulence RhuM family protein [Desulfatitalea alkaliphila]